MQQCSLNFVKVKECFHEYFLLLTTKRKVVFSKILLTQIVDKNQNTKKINLKNYYCNFLITTNNNKAI